MKIRQSIELDKFEIETIHTKAFGEKKGPEIAELVRGLFDDKTAMPILSLVAVEDEKLTGHILFTKAKIIQTAIDISAIFMLVLFRFFYIHPVTDPTSLICWLHDPPLVIM